MNRVVLAATAFLFLAFATPVLAPATESQTSPQLAQQRGNTLPKGSYQQSCSCHFSGGIYLQCYCANLRGQMFQTNMDVRSCPLPKDIRNCGGNLKCAEKGDEC
jgi:hypothetical protein